MTLEQIHKSRKIPLDKATFFDVRDRVQMCRRRAEDIETYKEKIASLWERATSMGSGEISDMPRAPMSSTSKLEELIEKKVDLEILLLELQGVQKIELRYVRRIAEKLPKDEKIIILMRYADRRSWGAVQDALYGSESDYEAKKESYRRRMYRRHESALDAIYSITKRDRIW